MELKLANTESENEDPVSFNRTFMELKLQPWPFRCKVQRCFNRTFMELKQYKNKKEQKDFWALIGPLWN